MIITVKTERSSSFFLLLKALSMRLVNKLFSYFFIHGKLLIVNAFKY